MNCAKHTNTIHFSLFTIHHSLFTIPLQRLLLDLGEAAGVLLRRRLRLAEDEDTAARRHVIYSTYHHALLCGDRHVSFVDGWSFFEPAYHDLCTVDGCHPNDAGFIGMARVLGREISRVLYNNAY